MDLAMKFAKGNAYSGVNRGLLRGNFIRPFIFYLYLFFWEMGLFDLLFF